MPVYVYVCVITQHTRFLEVSSALLEQRTSLLSIQDMHMRIHTYTTYHSYKLTQFIAFTALIHV